MLVVEDVAPAGNVRQGDRNLRVDRVTRCQHVTAFVFQHMHMLRGTQQPYAFCPQVPDVLPAFRFQQVCSPSSSLAPLAPATAHTPSC